MKNFLKTILALSVLLCIPLITGAQVGGNSLWKLLNGAIEPNLSTWTLGSASNRISKIWATDIDSTSLSIGSVSGDLDMGGYSITNIATTTTGEIRMTNRATFTIRDVNYDYIKFPAPYSTAIGRQSLFGSKANNNTAIGYRALGGLTMILTGVGNTVIGSFAMLNALPDSANNTAIGNRSMYNSYGTSSVAVGAYSGYYNDGSDQFYINNRDLTNTAGDKAYSLLYGTFGTGASTVGQSLTINSASTTINNVATSTLVVDSSSVSQGSCLKLKDFDGGGYTYVTVLDGVLTASANSCE